MTNDNYKKFAIGTKTLILSKLYFSALSKKLENIDSERYFSILQFISEHNGCTQQYICNNLSIDKTAMVKVIDYLIKTGLIDRNVNPDDRREHFIFLTKKGQKQTIEIDHAFKEIDSKIFENISKEDQATFNKVICSLSKNLQMLPLTDLFFTIKKTERKKKKNFSNKI